MVDKDEHSSLLSLDEIEKKGVIRGIEIGRINHVTHEIIPTRKVWFQCNSTTACCRYHEIPITERDIQRILDNGYDLFQFIVEPSPILIKSKMKEGAYTKAYVLKKKPFTTECVFLENGKCKIHEFKPTACRLYPFTLRPVEGNSDLISVVVHPDSVCASVHTEERDSTKIPLQIKPNTITLQDTSRILQNVLKVVIESELMRE